MSSSIPFDAYKGSEPFIFVSYAHKDRDSVFPLILRLHEQGFRIWYDEGIDAGRDWPDEVAIALDRACLLLAFLSPCAVESRNVRNEVDFAISKAKTLVCVYLEDTELPPGLQLRMGHIQAIHRHRLTDEHFQRKLDRALPEHTCTTAHAATKESASHTRSASSGPVDAAEQKAWEHALKVGTSICYKDFLSSYPNGVYAFQAQQSIAIIQQNVEDRNRGRAEAKAQKQKNDMEAAWQRALRDNSILAYQDFIQRHPDSPYLNQARMQLALLKERI